MKQSTDVSKNETPEKKAPALWISIIFLIIFVCSAVSLFAAIIYLFVSGAQQMGWPPWVHIFSFVIISGIFAWLVKRISDTVSGMSQRWFPEEMDDQ